VAVADLAASRRNAPAILLAVIIALLDLLSSDSAAIARSAAPDYVGSGSCAACHADQTGAWRGSHHDLAWTLPGEDTVFGDFDNAEFVHDGVTTRFRRAGDRPVIETEGGDGRVQAFPVVGVAGVAPLQQYILETEPGRLQSFDVVWDVANRLWYHLYADQHLPPGDGLHWTGPYKNWNARCAECHATGFEKRFDPATQRYASRQAEIGVGCEACHGPGEAHLRWAEAPEAFDPQSATSLSAKGLTIAFAGDTPQNEIEQCAGCHARREPFGDGNPLPGTAFADAYRLSLLREGLYHVDGSILDEVYVYGSFLQSKMHQRGVRCTDCHDPHNARLRLDGNAVCTQCHSPAANPRFPSLRKADYDGEAHHFHDPGSAAAACKACHMIERTYMGIDGRRDHSFRIPRPDLSVETGAPNACTDCHRDRDAAWAAAELAKRFGEPADRSDHFSMALAAGRADPLAASSELGDLAADSGLPAIVRATALDLLARAPSEAVAAQAAALLDDMQPLVREAAALLQQGAAPEDRVDRLAPLLADPVRSVRIATARALLAIPPQRIPDASRADLRAAIGEWQASLIAKADFPETHLVLGGAALVTRNFQAAEAAFEQAVELDPQRAEAWAMIVRIRAGSGDVEGAAEALTRALKAVPEDAGLLALRQQLEQRP